MLRIGLPVAVERRGSIWVGSRHTTMLSRRRGSGHGSPARGRRTIRRDGATCSPRLMVNSHGKADIRVHHTIAVRFGGRS